MTANLQKRLLFVENDSRGNPGGKPRNVSTVKRLEKQWPQEKEKVVDVKKDPRLATSKSKRI